MSKVLGPFVRSPYNYDTLLASDDSATVCVGDSLTVQSMTEDADLNVLMRRFGVTGKMPENLRVPSFGDFVGISNYQEALHAVMAAEDNFMSIPAEVRSRFSNDPQLFLEFCSDEANRDEMQRLGFLKPVVKVEEPKPMKVEVVNAVKPA